MLARTLTLPIRLLLRSASKLQEGDFSQRVHFRSKDEVGTLGNAFNTLAEKLRGFYAGLEQAVKERTAELDQSQKELTVKLNDVERLNKVMVGRELKMIELKKEIEELKKSVTN